MARLNWREGAVFVAQVVALSCALGIAIDVVTANVAVEYFTVHHPRIVGSESPWVMALAWGVGASWWAGLALAPFLWWANTSRHEPLPRKRVLKMVVKGMAAIWVAMMLVLVGVYLVGSFVPVHQRGATFEPDRRLMAVALAHMTEYALAIVVAAVLFIRIRRTGAA